MHAVFMLPYMWRLEGSFGCRSAPPTMVLGGGVSLIDLELTKKARLLDWRAPEIHLFLLPQPRTVSTYHGAWLLFIYFLIVRKALYRLSSPPPQSSTQAPLLLLFSDGSFSPLSFFSSMHRTIAGIVSHTNCT